MHELPPGIEKVSERRDGNEDGLPRVTKQNIWRHPNAHPLALDLLLLERYGQEYLEWEPEALRLSLSKDGYLLSNNVWTKILAVQVLHNSPSPWRQWEVFHWVCLGLNGKPPNFVYLEQPELGHLASGVDMMKIVDRTREFTDEIDKFITVTARHDGVFYLPAPLDFAQPELDEHTYHCTNCGGDTRDDGDVKCVVCGSESIHPNPDPHHELTAETARLWNERSGMPLEHAVDGLPDTPAGNAAYLLLVHWDYRNQVRSRLVTQLRMIRDES